MIIFSGRLNLFIIGIGQVNNTEHSTTIEPTTEPDTTTLELTTEPDTTTLELTTELDTTTVEPTTEPDTSTVEPSTTVPPTVEGRPALTEEFILGERLIETLATLSEEERSSLGYTPNDFIVNCQFNGWKCTTKYGTVS